MGAWRERLADFGNRHRAGIALFAIVAAACALYGPFVSNALLFDDKGHFSGARFYEYASSPFGLAPRFPASFSVAFIHVVFGTVEAQRVVSLLLHAAAGCAIFVLVRLLQRGCRGPEQPSARELIAAAAAAIFFVLHPVAVYGAAYLAQRSIVLATLFGVLSAAVFVYGLVAQRYAAALGAAALYSLAVLCKEHAILVAGVVPLAAWIVAAQKRFAIRYTAAYLVACVPASVFVFLLLKGILGEAYEPRFADVASEMALPGGTGAEMVRSPWLASVVTQLSLFARYVALWVWPDTGRMSFDLRVDFAAAWSTVAASAGVLAFLGTGLGGAWLAWRRGRAGMLGFGILWFWVLYLIEFSVARFQEPFVLYRSYLWAPGIAVALAVAVERLTPRVALAAVAVAALGLGWQAHDRLRTFSSGLLVWEDAAAKLPQQAVPGGSRTLYQLGREYFYAGKTEKATAVVDRCIAQYPGTQQCLFARAAMLLVEERYEAALPYLAQALAVRPDDGVARHHLGLALERLGCRAEAVEQYRLSLKYGFWGGAERLKSLEGTGGGILPASRARAPAEGFRCAEALKGVPEAPR